MLELPLNETSEVKFELIIEGTNNPVEDVRLSLDLPLYKLSLKGELKEGIVTFIMPNLSNLVQEGIYNYKLEAFVDEKYFAPIEDTINLKRPVKITSKPISEKKETKKLTVESKTPEVKQVVEPIKEEVTKSSVLTKINAALLK